MQSKPLRLSLSIIIVVLAALAVSWLVGNKKVATPVQAPTAAVPAPVQKPALDPIQIEAIKARQYPSSDITVVREASSKSGYREQVVSYQSDGLTIYAQVSIPAATAPAGGYPVVILDHGYIAPTEYQTASEDYRRWITAFAQAGFVVVKPDFRGHGQSQGTAEGGHFSPVYTYDNLNLIASLKKWNLVNSAKIGQIGHSMGAHVALRTAVVSSDVKATVSVNGVVASLSDLIYSWPRSPMPNDQPRPTTNGIREALFQKYGDPKANPEFWNSASAITYVKDITGPVQIHVGSADDNVPPAFSASFDAVLTAAGRPHQTFSYAGGDHQFTNATYRSQMLERSISLFKGM